MTIQQCKYVLKIAECGSFNEAAKQLFIAQSSLSVSVKLLEQEFNIRIFERAGNGVYLTNEGNEFMQYARKIAMQEEFITERYAKNTFYKQLSVSTQHYDFIADIFSKLLNETNDPAYRFSLREMKTHDVIRETETAYCDIGIIAIKNSEFSVMERYLIKRGLLFTPLLRAKPHIYLRREHPLSDRDSIAIESLKDFPYVSYEQGQHNISFFAEELIDPCSNKRVEISDRASLMNVLLQTDCYTIGTGIMPSALNQDRIISIPLESNDCYIIGYLLRTDRNLSEVAQTFINMMKTIKSE